MRHKKNKEMIFNSKTKRVMKGLNQMIDIKMFKNLMIKNQIICRRFPQILLLAKIIQALKINFQDRLSKVSMHINIIQIL